MAEIQVIKKENQLQSAEIALTPFQRKNIEVQIKNAFETIKSYAPYISDKDFLRENWLEAEKVVAPLILKP